MINQKKLKTILPILSAVLFVCISTGCNAPAQEKTLLTVDFQQAKTLRYQFTSSRHTEIDWGMEGTKGQDCCSGAQSQTIKTTKYVEKMEMAVAYKPIKIDPYGPTTIEATFESVQVTRRSGTKKSDMDAVHSLAGKSVRFDVGPTGKIEDYSQLEKLIQQLGEKAFGRNTSGARIKDPDMIADFITLQWFLWDSVSSIRNPAEGLKVGQTWKSTILVPTPMIMRTARDVTYRLKKIRSTSKGDIAVISSSYSLAEAVPDDWPVPYQGSFKVSGMFGFLVNYEVLDLTGSGENLFNIDTGCAEEYKHQYKMKLKAGLRFPLGPAPLLEINQTLTMKRLN